MFSLLLAAAVVLADDPLRCLDNDSTPNPGTLLYEHLQRRAVDSLAQRRATYEAVKTAEQVAQYQAEKRELFLRLLGPLPPRTPLDAHTVGRLEGDGYRVEKVIYASQPNHHVTANLYLPATPPPYPGVIVPCGHSHTGKGAEAYQRVCILLAKHGIAALCYDPIGQGERYQIFGPRAKEIRNPASRPNSKKLLADIPGQPEFDSVEEHTLIGVGAILTGTSTAKFRVWDGIRSLDYLASRADIDAQRLGCTGNSGGGTLTAYLMAIDERIRCAAPACYLTTFERLLASNGPQDAEQNLFGQIRLGLDEADYVLMRAPRPTLLLAGTRDATFDIRGTWEIYRDAKRFFARLDRPQQVDLLESDAPHGFTIQLREGAVHWMQRWLLQRDEAVKEPDFPAWKLADLQCTPTGQVMDLEGERSVFDLHRGAEQWLAERRRNFWSEASPEQARQFVRARAAIRPRNDLPQLEIREVGRLQRDGYRIDRLILTPTGGAGVPLPALALVPAQTPSGSAVLYLHTGGKRVEAGEGGELERLAKAGRFVLAVDLRGCGETESGRRDWSRGLFGPNGQEFLVAYLLGESLVEQRAEEIIELAPIAARYATSAEPRAVEIIATGPVGIAALHAAALEPDLFAKLTTRERLESWSSVLNMPLPNQQLTNCVHGALELYDLPDLERLVK